MDLQTPLVSAQVLLSLGSGVDAPFATGEYASDVAVNFTPGAFSRLVSLTMQQQLLGTGRVAQLGGRVGGPLGVPAFVLWWHVGIRQYAAVQLHRQQQQQQGQSGRERGEQQQPMKQFQRQRKRQQQSEVGRDGGSLREVIDRHQQQQPHEVAEEGKKEGMEGEQARFSQKQQQQQPDQHQHKEKGVSAVGSLDFEAALRAAYCSADARYAAAGYAVRQLASAVAGHPRERVPEGDLCTWLHQYVIERDSINRAQHGERQGHGRQDMPLGVAEVMAELLPMPASWVRVKSARAHERAHRPPPADIEEERKRKRERQMEGEVEKYYWRCHHCESALQTDAEIVPERVPAVGPQPVCLRCPGCGLAKYCSETCLQRSAAAHGKLCSLLRVVRKVRGFMTGWRFYSYVLSFSSGLAETLPNPDALPAINEALCGRWRNRFGLPKGWSHAWSQAWVLHGPEGCAVVFLNQRAYTRCLAQSTAKRDLYLFSPSCLGAATP